MNKEFLGDSLIFIISQPRAGSTLLQRILAANPQVHTSGEPWLMLHPMYALKNSGIDAEYDSKLAYTALQDFLTYYADGKTTYFQALRCMAKVLYERALRETGKELFLDKTPRYYFIIPDLLHLFPNAKFIFLVRNPLAVLYSIINTWVGTEYAKLAGHRYDLLLAPKRILEGIRLLGKNAIVVHYEKIVSEPESNIRELCQKLGLGFHREMLVYGNKPKPLGVMGDQTMIYQFNRPVTKSLDRWKKMAESPQLRHFALAYLEELGEQIVDELGYSFRELRQSIEQSKSFEFEPIIPWRIAIRPQRTWTREERLIYRKTLAVHEYGQLRGSLHFIRENYRSLLRSLLSV